MAHAKLSPSAASRWMACTPSAVLEQQFPNISSVYAEEGSFVHSLGEILLKNMHEMVTPVEYKKQFALLEKNGFYSSANFEYAEGYAHFVNDQCVGDFLLFVEQKLDLSQWIEEGYGTGDAIVVLPSQRKMIFDDYKHGKRVKVDAVDNAQLMIYALGAYYMVGWIYEIDEIEMNIYQPRLDNVSSWSISLKDLIQWAQEKLMPKAKLAFAGLGEFNPGKACTFCRCKAKCRALADFNMELARMDFKQPDLLTDEEILEVHSKQKLFEEWMKAVNGYIFTEAIAGKKWEGLKLVESKTNRKYSDEGKVAEVLTKNGFTEFYKAPSLLGLGDLEKKIGKAKFGEIVNPLLVKPTGAPTLASVNDKRPELADVKDDFQVLDENEDI